MKVILATREIKNRISHYEFKWEIPEYIEYVILPKGGCYGR